MRLLWEDERAVSGSDAARRLEAQSREEDARRDHRRGEGFPPLIEPLPSESVPLASQMGLGPNFATSAPTLTVPQLLTQHAQDVWDRRSGRSLSMDGAWQPKPLSKWEAGAFGGDHDPSNCKTQ